MYLSPPVFLHLYLNLYMNCWIDIIMIMVVSNNKNTYFLLQIKKCQDGAIYRN